MRPTGVIFDVDGTLADTNYLHVVAWARAFHEAGEVVTMARIHRLIGMGAEQLVEALLGRPRDDIAHGHTRHFRRLIPEIRAFPGGAELLAEVHRRGKVVALASSANSEQLEAMLEAIGAPEGVVDHVVGKDDVGRGKPDPDIFAATLERTGLDAGRAVVVGDTAWDVKAAEPLGLAVVGVSAGGISRGELEEAGAVAVYDDVAALLADLDRSPIGRLLPGGPERSAAGAAGSTVPGESEGA